MTLNALIFDCDGTLAETEEAHRKAFNLAFKEFDLPWHWGKVLYKSLLDITGGKERLRHYISAFHPLQKDKLFADDLVVRLHKRKTDIYGELLADGQLGLRPGVMRLLEQARAAGLKLAIATTTNMQPLTALFDGTVGREVMDMFDAIAAGDMVQNKKPAPDLYQLALQKLELAPADCLALEDSLNGFHSAHAAGLPVVITLSGYTEDQQFPDALAVVSDFGEPGAPYMAAGGLALTIHGPWSTAVSLADLQTWHQVWTRQQA